MRVLTCGFEVYDTVNSRGVPSAEGWGAIGKNNGSNDTTYYTNTYARKVFTQGGNYSLHIGDPFEYGFSESQFWKTASTETYFRLGYYTPAVTPDDYIWQAICLYGDASLYLSLDSNCFLQVSGSGWGQVAPYRIRSDRWYRLEIYVKWAVAGRVTVKVDGVVWLDVSADLLTGFEYLGLPQKMRIGKYSHEVYFDDIAVNNTWAVLDYDGGTGTVPVVGNVVTGALSGASGTVREIHGDATSGWFAIEMTDATNFQDNEAITDSGTFAALANGVEDRSNCSWVGEGVVIVKSPEADGATLDLTCSSGTDHYALVNSLNITDFVYDTVAGQYDTYEVGDAHALAEDLKHVAILSKAARNGTALKQIQGVVRPSTTDFFTPDFKVGTDYGWNQIPLHYDPDTKAPWTATGFNASEFGVRVRA